MKLANKTIDLKLSYRNRGESEEAMNNNIEIVEKPQNENDHLLPCPFCGCEEIVYMQYNCTSGFRWKVFCCGCAAEIDPGYAQSKGVVMNMWNKRI